MLNYQTNSLRKWFNINFKSISMIDKLHFIYVSFGNSEIIYKCRVCMQFMLFNRTGKYTDQFGEQALIYAIKHALTSTNSNVFYHIINCQQSKDSDAAAAACIYSKCCGSTISEFSNQYAHIPYLVQWLNDLNPTRTETIPH